MNSEQKQGKSTNIEFHLGNTHVQLQDVVKLPLLEAELKNLTMTQRMEGTGEVTTQLHTEMSLWSYNNTIRVWEVVVEPWDLIVRCD